MCIRDRCKIAVVKMGSEGSWIKRGDEVIKVEALKVKAVDTTGAGDLYACLLYTSDAADDLLCVDLGGRRIIKKKNTH